jgi:Na+/H+ antiporter NhaC
VTRRHRRRAIVAALAIPYSAGLALLATAAIGDLTAPPTANIPWPYLVLACTLAGLFEAAFVGPWILVAESPEDRR